MLPHASPLLPFSTLRATLNLDPDSRWALTICPHLQADDVMEMIASTQETKNKKNKKKKRYTNQKDKEKEK